MLVATLLTFAAIRARGDTHDHAHPALLPSEYLKPYEVVPWQERYESIVDAEKHWARNGCVILKFFLNVSQKEQHERFLDRIDEPDSNWKFQPGDFKESQHWDHYMDAYQDALRATSKPWAPWYSVPADSKSFMRRTVAEIIVGTLERVDLRYPEVTAEQKAEMARVKSALQAERQ